MGVIKWGILGTARIAEQQLIPAIKEAKNAILVAVASRSKDKAREFAIKHEIPNAYGDYKELLNDPDVDAIYIPLPNHLHAEWTIKAAEKGKHVLCEKPAAINTSQVVEMKNACKKHHVFFMEAFMYRFHPQWIKVKELLTSKEIGEITMINAQFSFFLSNMEDFRLEPEMGGGALYDVGCYCVNVSRMLLDSEPKEVRSLAKYFVDGLVDTSLAAVLKFPNNTLVRFDCSIESADRQFVEIVGTDGTIFIPLPFRPDKGTAKIVIRKKSGDKIELFEPFNMYTAQVEYFSSCILNNHEPSINNPEHAILNMQVIDAIYEATGRKK